MSITDTTVVDAVSIDTENCQAILTIIDGIEWQSAVEHAEALQAKINTYISFIESGQLAQSVPGAEDKAVVVQVVARFPLREESNDFQRMFGQLYDALKAMSIPLSWETHMSLKRQIDAKNRDANTK